MITWSANGMNSSRLNHSAFAAAWTHAAAMSGGRDADAAASLISLVSGWPYDACLHSVLYAAAHLRGYGQCMGLQ